MSALSLEVARRHQAAHTQLVADYGKAVADVWLRLESPELTARVLRLLGELARGAGSTVMSLAEANVATGLLAQHVGTISPASGDLTGFLASSSKSPESARLRFLKLLGEGKSFVDARNETAIYAADLARGDVATAMVEGTRAVGDANGVKRWEKIPGGDACDWCKKVASERLYTTPEKVPRHGSCRCTISPRV